MNGSPTKPSGHWHEKLPGVFVHKAFWPQNPPSKHSSISVQATVALPVKPGWHLQTKCPGRLQHSAFSPHKAANDGISHSLISE